MARAYALVGCPYDYPAHVGFALEASLKYPNLISPADLYNMIAQQG